MSQNIPNLDLIDRNLRKVRRERAACSLSKADFLIKHSVEDILDKISFFNREFSEILNIGSRSNFLSKKLTKLPGNNIVITCDISLKQLINETASLKIVLDEELIPFADSSFDLIVSCLNLHMINDLPGCLIGFEKILKPNGILILSIPGENNLKNLKDKFYLLELKHHQGISSRFLPNIELKTLANLATRVGFSETISDKNTVLVEYKSLRSAIKDIQNMGESNNLRNKTNKYLGKKIESELNNLNPTLINYEIITLTAFKRQ